MDNPAEEKGPIPVVSFQQEHKDETEEEDNNEREQHEEQQGRD